MIWIGKRVRFDAAHHLPNYEGLCRNVHGHTYIIEAEILVPINRETGMGVDFKVVSKVLEHEILGKFDHSDLNRFFANPTAEVLCEHFTHILLTLIPGVEAVRVKLYETPDSWVEKVQYVEQQ